MRWEIPAFALVGLMCGAILFFGSTEVSDVKGYRAQQHEKKMEKDVSTADSRTDEVIEKLSDDEEEKPVAPKPADSEKLRGDTSRALVQEQGVTQLISLPEKPVKKDKASEVASNPM